MTKMAMMGEKGKRNQSVECARLLCAMLVIFLHVELPEQLGRWIVFPARFAVPFFFMISGYYAFASSRKMQLKRVRSLLRLNLAATLVYTLWDVIPLLKYRGGVLNYFTVNYINWETLTEFLLFHVNPISDHLWYLLALLWCWLILMMYPVKEKKYRILLYGMCFLLLLAFFMLSTGVFLGGRYFYYRIYRNGWFMGLPVFVMGLFGGEYGSQIAEKRWAMGTLLGIGILLSVWQCERFGVGEMPIGLVFLVSVVILLLVERPVVRVAWIGKQSRHFGRISTVIYVIHMLVLSGYQRYLQEMAQIRLGEAEPWLRPFAVLGISLLAAILWEALWCFFQRRKNRIRSGCALLR